MRKASHRTLSQDAHTRFDAAQAGVTTHLERRYFEPGDLGFPVFTFRGVRIGLSLCNDRRWPETYRMLCLNGAQVVLIGYNTPVVLEEAPALRTCACSTIICRCRPRLSKHRLGGGRGQGRAGGRAGLDRRVVHHRPTGEMRHWRCPSTMKSWYIALTWN